MSSDPRSGGDPSVFETSPAEPLASAPWAGAPGTDPVPIAASPGPEAWPPWRAWEALGAIAALALSQLALGLAAGLLLPRFGIEDPSRRIAIALPVLVVGSHAVAWTAIAWILRRRHAGFRAGLRLADAPGLRHVRPYLAGIGLYVLALPVLAVFPPAKDQANPLTEIFRQGGPGLAALAVTAVALAPALEEALFRGLLLPVLRRRFRFWPAALAVTAIFTSLHVTQTGTYWPALAGIFACGLALAWLRERTGSLWSSIAFHMGFNSMPFLIWLIAQPFGGITDPTLG